jgi:hypothetical protein
MASNINPINIDGTFPIAGVDNDSQGFRTNFTNIKNNLTYAKAEIESLQNNSIQKNQANNLGGTILSSAEIKDFRETVVDLGTVSGTVILNHANGHEQKLTTAGSVTVTFANLPLAGAQGRIALIITVTSLAHTLTVPTNVNQGMYYMAGWNPQGNYISFGRTGTFIFEFTTTDGGVNIHMQDKTRGRDQIDSDYLDLFPPDGNAYVTNNSSNGHLFLRANVGGTFSNGIQIDGYSGDVITGSNAFVGGIVATLLANGQVATSPVIYFNPNTVPNVTAVSAGYIAVGNNIPRFSYVVTANAANNSVILNANTTATISLNDPIKFYKGGNLQVAGDVTIEGHLYVPGTFSPINFVTPNATISGTITNTSILNSGINNTQIGNVTPNTGAFTSLTATTVTATGAITGYLNGIIGANTQNTATFSAASATTLTATGNLYASNALIYSGSGAGTLVVGSNASIGTYYNQFSANNAVLQMTGNVNSYSQVVLQNKSSGSVASADLALTSDNGNDINNFINLGINSSLNADAAYTIHGPSDGYLYVASNASTGGNLVIGTSSSKDIIFHQGGTLAANEIARFKYGQGLVLEATTTSLGYTTGALTVAGGVGIGGALYVNGTANFGAVSTSSISSSGSMTVNGTLNAQNINNTGQFSISNTFIINNGAAANLTANASALVTTYKTTFANVVSFTQGTDSSSLSTGAIIVTGGAAISGNVQVGGNVNMGNSGNIFTLTGTIGAGQLAVFNNFFDQAYSIYNNVSSGGYVTLYQTHLINNSSTTTTINANLYHGGDGQIVTVSTKSAITNFYLIPNVGETVIGNVTTLAAGGFCKFQYLQSPKYWIRVG